jgi:hypothetical protein
MTVAQLFHLIRKLPPDYPVLIFDTDEDTRKEAQSARVRGLGLTIYTGDYTEFVGGEDEHHHH